MNTRTFQAALIGILLGTLAGIAVAPTAKAQLDGMSRAVRMLERIATALERGKLCQ